MAGIFPASGVPASEARNTASNPALAPGCEALYVSESRCTPRFDPSSYNAIISELVNLVTCLGGTYDCERLDNLCTILLARLNVAAGIAVFTNTGNFVVPDGITEVESVVIGAGGAGGASGDGSGGGVAGNVGAGGGAGGYAFSLHTGLVPGTIIPATVGAAGLGQANDYGLPGGASSFLTVVANGGGGGGPGKLTIGGGGIGGSAINGNLVVPGGSGGFAGPNTAAAPTQSDVLRIYGRGGMAAGGLSTTPWGGTGNVGAGYGTGGGGASGGSGLAGAAGAKGVIILRW